jgi:hypothetical protein
MGVVRGCPLLRPRTVSRWIKPTLKPARTIAVVKTFPRRTKRGTCDVFAILFAPYLYLSAKASCAGSGSSSSTTNAISYTAVLSPGFLRSKMKPQK